MKAKTFRIVTFSIVGALLAILIAVNVVLSVFAGDLIRILSGSSLDAGARGAGETLAETIQEEGSVLVKNDGNTLPLGADVTKVNVFGWSASSWIMTGSGSGQSSSDTGSTSTPKFDLLGALKEANIEYNTELIEMYKRFGTRSSKAFDTLHAYDYESSNLIEPSITDTSRYTSELLANAEKYSDVAFVVLSRVAGESNDAPLVQYKGGSSTPSDTTKTYLDASTEELALLEYVGETYDKVVVLINSTNQMNLNFLDEIPGLDACLIVGPTGNVGAKGVVDLLWGEVSPSGKTADTYAYDFSTNAVFANAGSNGIGEYTNASGMYPIGEKSGNFSGEYTYKAVSYLDYVEGIYVGYKWYETADAEGFWSSNFAKEHWNVNGYDDVVQFPFGYGLTYTNFEWEVVDNDLPSTITAADLHKTYTITVNVKNTGTVPAQEVVELYFTPPYNKGSANAIEKSAVNLLDFAKTNTPVEPGKEQVVELQFTLADLASYDSQGVKIDDGGWIIEQGDYEISLRTDAHNVAKVSRGKSTFSLKAANDLTGIDEEQAHNLFTGDDAMDYGISVDGSNTDANITYLSRGDIEHTFPLARTANRAMTQKLRDTNLYKAADAQAWLDRTNEANGTEPLEMPKAGDAHGIHIFDESGRIPNDLGIDLGADYDDPRWDEVLDQITVSEMESLVLHAYVHEEKIPSIGKEETQSVDGPSQFGSFNQSKRGVGYPNPIVLAQTWNKELAKSFGLSVAKEAGSIGKEGWYAPGINLHRSAFGGRNYEYFSEDPYLTGVMGAKVTEGSLDMGIYVYVKHIIGYDQESARDSLYCWMTEQALRENYLKPFKICIDEGGATGLMSSYGRLGAVWAGGSEALLTGLLRDEWGFKGAIITDYSDHQNFMNADQFIRNGGDLWMDGVNKGSFRGGFERESAAFRIQLREATHHVLYMICNAAYVNSTYNENADVPYSRTPGTDFPLWTIVGVVDAVIIAGCGVWVFFAIRKKDKVKEEEAE